MLFYEKIKIVRQKSRIIRKNRVIYKQNLQILFEKYFFVRNKSFSN